uniref:Uncharacterized protein n=1 Tax=Tanacetum cinerariifolium TaxID=118510 RepID=A0A699QKD3_TANCI|nr:hypothetical protein [Tanacetum cinerariifolium]
MAFRNFLYTKYDEDLAFLPKEPSSGFVNADSGQSPKPELFVVHLGSVAARIKDRKCKTRGGSSRPPVKRKLASGSPRILKKLRGECDVMRSRERARKEECEGLWVKCEATMTEF